MKLQTVVDIKPSEWKIGYEDKVLLVGSCFADSIGQMMAQRGLHVTCNPFGTLYNPVSIANALKSQITIQRKQIDRNDISQIPIVFYDGLWHSMAHHGSFSRSTEEETRAAVAESVEVMQRALKEANVVIVTFGTAWVYEMDGRAVANCHKLPAERFTRRRLSADEIVEIWRPIVAQYPDKHWLFTVSPIRHIKDGLHENQLSKATLLQAVEQIVNGQSQMANHKWHYFPSYEIMLDELRDYRFYAEDLVHPSPVAIQYIWERFAEVYCTPQTRNEMQLQLKAWKRTLHIPLH